MAPASITLSLTTVAELVFASAFILSVVLISRKPFSTSSATSTPGSKKSKPKKKARKVDIKAPEVVEAPAQPAAVEPPAPKAAKKKAAVKPTPAVPAPTPTPAPASAPAAPSIASVAAPDAPSPAAPKAKKTFVESRLRPAAPTAMDDMRDESIDPVPQVARVMRIVDGKANVAKFAAEWDEWEEPKEDEGEWEVAKVKSASLPSLRRENRADLLRRARRQGRWNDRFFGVRCFQPCARSLDPWPFERCPDGDDEEAAREPEEGGARRGGQGGCRARTDGAIGSAQASVGACEVRLSSSLSFPAELKSDSQDARAGEGAEQGQAEEGAQE